MKSFLINIFLFLMLINSSYSQNVFINEIMSSNSNIIADEDGDFPDWFEIYNAGDQIIDLTNFSISDDPTKLGKWIFPNVFLQPHEHLLIFASGKDKKNGIDYWETIISWGDEWKYLIGDSEPPISWSWVGIDDSGWNVGRSGFGYGDNDDHTVVPHTISIYLRKSFHIDNIENIVDAVFHIDYDDAFVAYINGDEIARANIGEPGFIPPYNYLADSTHEAVLFQGEKPGTFPIDNIQSILHAGENVLAVQVHNQKLDSSDLTAIPFLTLGMIEPPQNPAGVSPDIELIEGSLHTNFKLKSEGEQLFLSNPTSGIIDQVNFNTIPTDVSFGRVQDGASIWGYFNNPTPGCTNAGDSYQNILEKPIFSLSPGFYSGTVQVEFTNNDSDVQIYYTIDNTEPDKNSSYYSAPIYINSTKVIRARAYKNGSLPSDIVTGTFFIDESISLPVISLSTSGKNLWDENTGIYVLGPNAEKDFPYFGANFWEDWERPIHLEFFETNGNLEFKLDAGTKVFGGWSRGFKQKSLAIYARSEYGFKSINYPLFPDKPFTKYESIVLRNSGNDWNYSLIRDPLMQGLMKETSLVTQAYRPVVVFLNGLYWGIHNIREKINEHYIAANYDVDPDNIDFLEFDNVVIQGDELHYHEMLDFIDNNVLSISANYDHVKTMMDVDNFIDYQIAQIYFDNKDWPGNNIKFWRSRTQKGKWRWLLYDTDFGYGLFYPEAYKNNTLEFATDPNSLGEYNPPWSTFILRSLLENPDFKNLFINRFSDFLNSIFLPEVVHNKIEELIAGINQEIQRHINRWQHDYEHWQNEMDVLRNFATFRPAYVRSHIIQKFNLSGTAQLTLNVLPENSGRIKISSLDISEFPWQGHYFKGIPVKVSALPNVGYQFSSWEGHSSVNRILDLSLDHDIAITANFIPAPVLSGQIIINEINYASMPDFNTEDWIELYNNGENSIDLSDWFLNDSENNQSFILPQATVLDPKSYLVVCRDTLAFKIYYPNLNNCTGNFDFGLSSNGDAIRLYDFSGNLADSLSFGVQSPWPSEANGAGLTLTLTDPNLDNAKAGSWTASFGTPGKENIVGVNVDQNGKDSFLPTTFQVNQNYPNPFNRETIIRFKLPESGVVKGVIYNAEGRKTEKIFEKGFSAGTNQVIWHPDEDIPSGIYFVKMVQQQTASITMKILYIK